jgi:superoxide dismutase
VPHTPSTHTARGKAKKDVGHGGLDEWFSGHGEGKDKAEGEATWGDWVAISPVKKKVERELADGKVKEKTVQPGDIVGPCGVSDDPAWKGVTRGGKDPLKCMPRQKAHDMPRKERAELAREKMRKERDGGNSGKEPTRSRTFEKEAADPVLAGDNEPTNPDLWEEAKDDAKDRYTKWPSAYAVGHALKIYKDEGGGWRKKKASVGKHVLPKLPYAYDALEPHISEETLKFHHDKHHKSYVDGLNDAERAIAEARDDGDFDAIPALNAAQAFHAGGHLLHTDYWESLTPDYEEPSDAMVAAVERDFGSWDAFRSQMKESMVKVRGSGWGVLVWTPDGMRVLTVMNHENGVLWNGHILLPIDAWEHAYYIDYRNDRAAHFDAVFDELVDWSVVERRLKAARGSRTAAARVAARREVDCHLEHHGLDDLVRGGSATLYHGTTRQFQRFDTAHIRHDLVNRFYKAPGIFLTPRKGVAEDYAQAARNSKIHMSVVDDLVGKNRGAGEVLGRLVREGRDAWDGLFEDARAMFPDAASPVEALEMMTGGVDPNTLMDIAGHVDGSKYTGLPEADTLFDLWGGVPKGTPAYIFDDMESVGLDPSEYRPKVYTVTVSGLGKVLVTKSKSEAEKARTKGYDAVVFCGADLVDGVPEVVVFDPSRVRVTKVDVIDTSPSGDDYPYYNVD